MEVHFVHKKTDYASVGAALDFADGLAVIGIMFQVADTSDDGLEVSCLEIRMFIFICLLHCDSKCVTEMLKML